MAVGASVSLTCSSAAARKSRNTAKSEDDIPDEGSSTSLRERVCMILNEAQKSNTGQRKLVVGLRKIQEACCYEPTHPKKQNPAEDFDENDFNIELVRGILRVLPVKRSEPVGDRLVRFAGSFLKHATELDNAIFAEQDPDQTQIFPETPTSRLTSHIISTVLPLLQAKDKVVRFRCTQIIAHFINTLDSVDDELFHHIRIGLLKRLRDKEANVRVQAVCGLGRLAGVVENEEDPENSDDDTAGAVLDKLLDVLQHDPSAEVRRSLLLNLPFTPNTLPYLFERARDLDASIRRALYARLLPALGDFRHLSVTHREKLLRWGLRDRDESVRRATGRLFRERWIEDCARPRDENDEPIEMKPGQVAEPNAEALKELLERIDVVNAGNDGGIALDAMREFWEGRPDYRDHVSFDEAFWMSLTPEGVFVARTFNDFVHAEHVREGLAEKLPEVTRLAYLLQSNINSLAQLIRRIAVEEEAEEDSVHQEFIVEQLIHIALTMDYSDEVGRRTMFGLMREALTLAELPEEATKLVVEVLKMSCGVSNAAEREFCSVVLEAIAEVHDTIIGDAAPEDNNADDSFVSARSEVSEQSAPEELNGHPSQERAIKEIMVNMKCLHIAQCMLQNVEDNLEGNSDLITMLNNLVVPAVRSQEAPVRERGLLCLGLCCLLDKNLADENLTLFLHCFTKGHEQLQLIAIQIIGDILTVHPSMLFNTAQPGAEESCSDQQNTLDKPIHKLFSKSLKSGTAPVQSTACAALSKLLLSMPSSETEGNQSILRVPELLKLLVVAYFDPETASNAGLRQALSYFLPVYCHSRKENMQWMSSIALDILQWYLGMKEELDVEAEDEADCHPVGVQVVVNHLVDWTDGRKLALARAGTEEEAEMHVDSNAHLDFAERALDKMLGPSTKDERKLYLSVLGKLHVAGDVLNHEKVQSVSRLVGDAIEDKVANDAASRNALTKLQAALEKVEAGQEDYSQSRNASQHPSAEPSTLDEEADESRQQSTHVITEAMEDMKIQSTTLSPAVGPTKQSSRQTPAPNNKLPQDIYEDEQADDSKSTQSAITTPTSNPRKIESSGSSIADVPPLDDHSMALEQENIPPTSHLVPSPPKTGRRTIKTGSSGDAHVQDANETGHREGSNEPHVKIEDASENVGSSPVKKPRGRPKNVALAASQPRKSIRAGRRKLTGDE